MTTHQNRAAVPRRRRLIAVAGATTLTAATLLVGAPQASAASQSITAATFEWPLGEIFQYTVPGLQQAQTPDIPRCLLLSAGSIETNAGSLVGSSYSATAGNVQVLKNGVAPTFETRCDGAAAPSATATPINQKVVWSNGTGSRDTATGATTINFTGMMSIKLSGSPIRIENPVLTVNADGTGALTAKLLIGTSLATSVASENVNVAEFEGLDVNNAGGFTKRPNYAGKTANVTNQTGTVIPNLPTQLVRDAYALAFPLAADPANAEKQAGAWPQSWMTAIGGDGGRFHSNSSANPPAFSDQVRRTSPMTVSYGALGPVTSGQTLGVSVPTIECTGEIAWAISAGENGAVEMGAATFVADRLRATGAIDPITITDSRVGNGACRPAFAVAGSVSEFTAPGVPAVPASYLGWQPNVDGDGLVSGPTVAPGYEPTGDGLSEPTQLVSIATDTTGSGTAGAGLTLEMPATTPPGAYQGTLTLTGLT